MLLGDLRPSTRCGRRHLSLLAVSVAVVVVACTGGDSGPREPREVDLEEWARETCRVLEDVPDADRIDPSRLERTPEAVDQLAAVFEEFRDSLELLIPPREARRAHNELVDWLDDTAKLWRDFARRRDERSLDNPARLERDVAVLVTDTVNRAFQAIAVVQRSSAANGALQDAGCG